MSYTVRRVRVNAQGYALPGGYRYWGAGEPLYVAVDRETGDELAHVRAPSREAALRRFAQCEREANLCCGGDWRRVPEAWYINA